jgi:SAM-dependent methyltransferase
MKVLEIGCGAGRVTRALARFFGEVYAVDISRQMVRQTRQAVSEFPTAHIFHNNGKDLSVIRRRWWHRFGLGEKIQFDFAFSCLVFQHIPSREVIESYLREVNRLLRPGALFKFQVQGSPVGERNLDDSWIGLSLSEQDARALAQRTGFDLRYQHGAGSQYYWLWFFKK